MTKTIHTKIAECESTLQVAKNEKADLDALMTLLKNNGAEVAPASTTRFGADAREVLVGVGKDHTVRLYMFTDDIEELHKLLGVEYEETR